MHIHTHMYRYVYIYIYHLAVHQFVFLAEGYSVLTGRIHTGGIREVKSPKCQNQIDFFPDEKEN